MAVSSVISYGPPLSPNASGMQFYAPEYTLTDGATVAIDWNNGNSQTVTLGGNRTFTFANPKAGAVYTLEIVQDGTGGRTLTWPTVTWLGTGTAPVLDSAASAKTIVQLTYDGSAYVGSKLSSTPITSTLQYYAPLYTLTDGSTIAVDWNNGNVQTVVLGAAGRTVTFANLKSGARYIMIVAQDGTGSRTITTWPTIKWTGGSAPTLTTTASKKDLISFVYDGTDVLGSSVLNF